MKNAGIATSTIILVVALTGGLAAADAPLVYRGARILTATGAVYSPGVLIVEDGKIAAVGNVGDVTIPDGANVIDATEKVIIPGLVDTHSHLGVYSRPQVAANRDGNEMTGPVQSIVRALDSLNPFDPGIRMANAGGVTTANIMPGSGNVIGGQTIYVKLRGYSPEQMWIDDPRAVGGLKMANGENPKRSYGRRGKAPGTRMKVAALQRATFIRAQQYKQKWDRYREQQKAGEEVDPPDRDVNLEPIVEVLEGRRTVHFHTHRADDILTVLRLKREFGFDLLIQHGTESYKVIDEIAAAGVPVSLTIVDSPGGKQEVVDFIDECGAELAKAGIKVLINTDDPVTESRFFLRTAAIAVRGGLSEELALKAITLFPAEVMRLDHRLGSLEAGKDADFVLLSGPPFSTYTRVLETFIDGKKVFDLADSSQRLFQTGGFAVQQKGRIPEPAALIRPEVIRSGETANSNRQTILKDAKEILVRAGRVYTVSHGMMDDAAILLRDGEIVAIGPGNNLKVGDDVPVLTAAAVTPGLIDAHSVVPLDGEYNIIADQDADEESDPNQADVRVLDAFNPAEPLMRFLLSQGVTVVHACPGRANVIGGMTGVFRTHGRSAESMAIRVPQALLISLGSVPKKTYDGRRPATRMGTAGLLREAFTKATNYRRKQRQAKDDEPGPDRDLKLEAVGLALDKNVRTMFCAQRADDIQTALRISSEFGLDAQIALASDGYLIREQLAESNVPVIVHPTMQRVRSIETYNSFLGNATALSESGIPIAIGSGFESYVPKTRVIRHEAAMAMVYGLGFERALRAITLDAAKILGIDDRFGSIELGKSADLVLYDGDPFEHTTHTTHVIVNGEMAYDRAERLLVPLAKRMLLSTPEPACCLEF